MNQRQKKEYERLKTQFFNESANTKTEIEELQTKLNEAWEQDARIATKIKVFRSQNHLLQSVMLTLIKLTHQYFSLIRMLHE